MKYLKWFYKTVKRDRSALAVMMLCHVMLTVCAIGFVYASKKLVDIAVAMLAGAPYKDAMVVWVTVMIAIVIIRIGLNATKSYLQTKTEIRVKNRLRSRLFSILLRLQSDGGARHHSGDVISRLQEDVRVVSNVVASSLPNLFGTLLQLMAAFVFLMILDARLALIVIVLAPIGLIIGKLITRKIRNLTHDIRQSDAQVHAHLQESVQHITLIQSMEHTDASYSALGELQGNLYGNEIKRVKFSIFSRILISLAFQLVHTIAFIWSVVGISKGTVTYGMMTAFLQLVGQIQRPIVDLSSQVPSIIHSTASIDRIMELEALPREEEQNPIFVPGLVGVKMSDVTFAYPDSNKDVLHGFSHDFTPGSKTAVVGPTGIGKSTTVRLLLSLLKPKSGSITLYSDQQEGLVEVSPATRCNLVYVPQGNSLFSGTVRENLLMGNPEATHQQLEDVLRMAAADFVFALPKGMDTQCFEAGAGLSEGQAQRIAIARALLRPGSVMLLDEFSSALDAETETMLMERLTSSLSNRTMIFITHREKIIDYCTDVLRLN